MDLRIQQGGILARPPTDVRGVEYVVVFDRFSQPVAIIEEVGQDVVKVSTASNRDFPLMLRRLGVTEKAPPSTVIEDGP